MIRLGIISYLNTLPVYYAIEKGLVSLPSGVEVVKDVPSVLNRMLSRGELDVSVVSSFEYALHHKSYLILPGLSIAAERQVKSVLFLSNVPMEDLTGREVYLTSASFTSKNLLLYLFKKLDVKPVFKEFRREGEIPKNGYYGILAIGDDALVLSSRGGFRYIYDLAELWRIMFGKPFVFAVWCVRKEAYKRYKALVEKLWRALIESKRISRGMYEEIAKEKSEELGLDFHACLDYLKVLHFDLEEEFVEGMRLFFKKMYEEGFLKEEPDIEFAFN